MSVAGQAAALERLDFAVAGGDGDLTAALRAASLLVTSELDGQEDAQDLFAVARADYGKLLGALYAAGHYSGVINILIDGREAAGIAPLDAPSRIDVVTVRVDPGPAFRLSEARIGPQGRHGAFQRIGPQFRIGVQHQQHGPARHGRCSPSTTWRTKAGLRRMHGP